MRGAVGRAVLSKDVSQLDGRPRHRSVRGALGGAGFGGGPLEHPVQRAAGGGDRGRRNGGVTGCGVDAAVAEQRLNDTDVRSVFQQVRGEAVTQGVGGNAFAHSAPAIGFSAGGLHGACGEVQVRPPGGKQPDPLGPHQAIVGAEQFQQGGGKHGIAVLGAFAGLHADQRAVAIDICDAQRDGFGNAETGAVTGQQNGPNS